MEEARQEITAVKNAVVDIKATLNDLYIALMGSHLTKDGGLVSRVIASEEDIEKLRVRIDELDKKENKQSLYLNIIWASAGFITSVIVIAIINHFFK